MMNGRALAALSMIAWILAAMIGLAGVFAGLVAGQVIGIRYPQEVENRVLLHPEHVRAVVGNHVVLEDGRDIVIAEASLPRYAELARLIADSDNMVDVDSDGDGYEVSVRERGGGGYGYGCMMPWARPIQIPLIADPIEVNARVSLGHGVLNGSAARAPTSPRR